MNWLRPPNVGNIASIRKLLVANRGEIALRVMRACRELDIATVAVHSVADLDAPFVQAADEAVLIGDGPAASSSYLRVDAILDAARRVGADAIHPGYGFLSENEGFARRCEEEGIIFVGPTPEAIASMGSKRGAKLLLRERDASIPLIPGYDGADQSTETLNREAKRIGFPVLLKASAGGGGKGMRVVREASQLVDAIDSAKRESRNSFGDDTLLIEKYFDDVRHIEFQIMGDQYGNVVHLNERECSVQRRHQKVIEEAPSVIMTPALRERMGHSAVAIGRAINYRGAGTVEFIADDQGHYYFLEVNTRLQVEHPVTEMTTGVDLVQAQIHVAQGASLNELGLKQEALLVKGHAIECRLYAEDPDNNFFPCTGRVLTWQPAAIAGVRYDGGIRSGSEISVYYDPLICKIIAHAPTREEALNKMVKALRETVILGLTTNKVFLQQVLLHPDFRSGHFNTHFIDHHLPADVRRQSVEGDRDEMVIAALLWDWRRRERARSLLRRLPSGWRNSPYANSRQEFVVAGGDKARNVAVEYRYEAKRGTGTQRDPNAHFYVKVNSAREYSRVVLHQHHMPVGPQGEGEDDATLDVSLDGLRRRYIVNAAEDRIFVHSAAFGESVLTLKSRYAQAFVGDAAGEGEYIAQMPGKILQLLVADGKEVAAGEALLVMESMKMESKISAHKAGKVKLHVREEQIIQEGTRMLTIE